MFEQQYEYYKQLIEEYLTQLPYENNLISDSMKYSLMAGGKRIRPVLALACVEIVGGQPEQFIREAAALELIHTYSLIHDDLPAMDDDDFRRGKPSNHKVFGEAAAILAGDALLTCAFELIAQQSPATVERQLRVIKETAVAIGWQGMVGGQVMDTLDRKKDSLADIEKIHCLKTGCLLKASARLGAILGGGTDEETERISQYASCLGLAFQIKDDILDVTGESRIIGKPSGSDQKLGKPTYISVLGLSEAEKHLQKVIVSAKNSLSCFGLRADFLLSLADYVAERRN